VLESHTVEYQVSQSGKYLRCIYIYICVTFTSINTVRVQVLLSVKQSASGFSNT